MVHVVKRRWKLFTSSSKNFKKYPFVTILSLILKYCMRRVELSRNKNSAHVTVTLYEILDTQSFVGNAWEKLTKICYALCITEIQGHLALMIFLFLFILLPPPKNKTSVLFIISSHFFQIGQNDIPYPGGILRPALGWLFYHINNI